MKLFINYQCHIIHCIVAVIYKYKIFYLLHSFQNTEHFIIISGNVIGIYTHNMKNILLLKQFVMNAYLYLLDFGEIPLALKNNVLNIK